MYRYDIKGKGVLKTLCKYYASDLGIKKIKSSNKEINYSISLENIVFNELINKGYEVYVGKIRKGEVDFMAKKDNEFKYIQVSLYLNEQTTIDREFGFFQAITISSKKYVISLDKINLSKGDITHLNIFDFLMDDNF